MNGLYSSRDIEKACRRDICFMWLLNGEPTPDHTTISRFQNGKLENAIEDLFYQFVMYLNRIGEVDFENVFIDGTKIEANANKYSFVWRSAVEKNYEKLQKKLEAFTVLLRDVYSLPDTMAAEDCGLYLAELAKTVQLVFRHGKGQRKTPLQRNIEQLTELLDRKYKYIDYLSEFQGRKSFSKTDSAATFMYDSFVYTLTSNGYKADGYEILDDDTIVEFYTNRAGETVYYYEHFDRYDYVDVVLISFYL